MNIYHEKQKKELCALHVLNNLLQDGAAFSKSDLDVICAELTPTSLWWNPHCSALGTGNYDVNVISKALHNKGYDMTWYDKRRNPDCLVLSEIKGFIVNTPNDMMVGSLKIPLPFQRRHWIAMREVNNDYYNLDSKLPAPACIGKAGDMLAYLRHLISVASDEIFVVVTTEVSENVSWRNDTAQPATS